MTDLQAAKNTVRAYMAAFDSAAASQRLKVLQDHTISDYRWRGMHPFHEQPSASDCIVSFWGPLLGAFSHLTRREDVFLAGQNDCDAGKTTWTCSMGHFMGLFDAPWLGIKPTGKMTFLRYAEFHRVDGGKVAETALFFDVLSIVQQAGHRDFTDQTGAQFVHPGPLTHDGIQLHPMPQQDGTATLDLVNRMARDISTANEVLNGKAVVPNFTPKEELQRNWHDDMIWYGPAGIGATYTIDRYIEQHQQPFRQKLANRTFHGHVARIAEGNYCAFFGWPNLSVTPAGGYMGLPASDQPAPMRVVDVYRRDGDKLAENWVFIDMLHFLNKQGVDVLSDIS